MKGNIHLISLLWFCKVFFCFVQAAFPVFTIMLFFSTHNELKSIKFHTLNSERMGILAKHWVQHKEILQPGGVGQMEGLWGVPKSQIGVAPVAIGGLEQLASTPEEILALMEQHQGDKYMVNLKESSRTKIAVSLR